MDPQRLWMELNALARQLGVRVRLESLEAGEEYQVQGGLCRLGPRLVAFVDRRLGPLGRSRQLATALKTLDLGGVYLRPAVRQFLMGEESPEHSEDE
ncbi:MAG: hypothetical protein HY794_09960 [Desulfarculus sp.]|nr:hypothetical protein [Desulfarculus sp.]